MNKSTKSPVLRGWDTYWERTRDAEAFASGGVSHPVVASFWDNTLGELLTTSSIDKILDIATGSGAVVERLTQRMGTEKREVTCVDISAAAIDVVRGRFPEILGVVADAKSIPLDSGKYDLVTSQFGIEYAGLTAIDEACRLLAPGGSLVLMMHIRPGIIFSECTTALDAIERTQKSNFVPLTMRFFEAGFAAVLGAERAAYDQTGRRLNPAIEAIESVLSDHGQNVAGGTIAKLYADVQAIHSRIQFYEPKEVRAWLRTMERELGEYRERMASMCDAASDVKAFDEICENLRQQELDIVTREPLLAPDNKLPIAWVVRAIRSN